MKKATSRTVRHVASDAAVGGSTFRYVETSALLAALLHLDRTADQALRGDGCRIASELTFVEALRVVVRRRVAGDLTASEARSVIRRLRTFKGRCDTVSISEDVLQRATRPFPVEPVRTLDAIHLATAELIDEQPQMVTIVTRDRRIRENAIALGFMVE